MGAALRKFKRRLASSEPSAPPPPWYADAVEAIERALFEDRARAAGPRWRHGLVVLAADDGEIRVESLGDPAFAEELMLAERLPMQLRARKRSEI
jgi:hypothetical protein